MDFAAPSGRRDGSSLGQLHHPADRPEGRRVRGGTADRAGDLPLARHHRRGHRAVQDGRAGRPSVGRPAPDPQAAGTWRVQGMVALGRRVRHRSVACHGPRLRPPPPVQRSLCSLLAPAPGPGSTPSPEGNPRQPHRSHRRSRTRRLARRDRRTSRQPGRRRRQTHVDGPEPPEQPQD